MYTSLDRTKLISNIEKFSYNMDDVQALLIVGSGESGFRDAYSDVDLLVVVRDSEKVHEINNRLREHIHHTFHLHNEKIYYHEEDIIVSCFFFEDYLAFDLGVWSFSKLRATKPEWSIMFDKDHNVENKLTSSLQKLTQPNVQEFSHDSLSYMWQFFRSAAVAIKRGQFVKAVKDIDVIRNQIIELICLHNKVYYDYDKSIDLIKSEHTKKLISTYEVKMEAESLRETLFRMMELYFEVISLENKDEIIRHNRIVEGFFEEILMR